MTSTEFSIGLKESGRVSSKVLKPPGGDSHDIFNVGRNAENTRNAVEDFAKKSDVLPDTDTKTKLFGVPYSDNSGDSDKSETLRNLREEVFDTDVFGNRLKKMPVNVVKNFSHDSMSDVMNSKCDARYDDSCKNKENDHLDFSDDLNESKPFRSSSEKDFPKPTNVDRSESNLIDRADLTAARMKFRGGSLEPLKPVSESTEQDNAERLVTHESNDNKGDVRNENAGMFNENAPKKANATEKRAGPTDETFQNQNVETLKKDQSQKKTKRPESELLESVASDNSDPSESSKIGYYLFSPRVPMKYTRRNPITGEEIEMKAKFSTKLGTGSDGENRHDKPDQAGRSSFW